MSPIVFLSLLHRGNRVMNGARKSSLPGIFFFPPLITNLTFFIQKAIKESDPTISNKVRRLVLQMFKSQEGQRPWCSGSRHDQQRPAVSDTTSDHYSLSPEATRTTTPWSWCSVGQLTTAQCSVEQLPAIHDAVWNNCPLSLNQHGTIATTPDQYGTTDH